MTQNSASVADVLLDWGDDAVDREQLAARIENFLEQYHSVPLAQLDLAAMLSDLVAILRDHDLALPPDLALLIKAFIGLEGMGRQLDPKFDMARETTPFLQRVLLAHYSPEALVERGRRTVATALHLLTEVPQDLSQLLRAALRGRLQVDIVPLRGFGAQIDRAASRLTMGIVTASLIIGSSIALTAGGGLRTSGLPLFGLFGFIGAVIGGIWVLASVWRSGRKH